MKRILIIALLCIPFAAWAFYKPMRVLAPGLVSGIVCVSEDICLDDDSRYSEAAGLYADALSFVQSAVAEVEKRPRAVFCATEECFRAFGFENSTARAVGVSGIVISPRGWKPEYIRHEMIHYLQAERLGVLTQWLGPRWLIEGMAYSLSRDPRPNLSQPWQGYREEFDTWLRSVGRDAMWEEARKL